MIALEVRTRADVKKVLRKAARQNIRSIGHAARALRLIAQQSIRNRKKPSRPGEPPHTRGAKRLRKAILYDIDQAAGHAVIGPVKSMVGPAGALHEHGGHRGRKVYPPRPYMGPALTKILPRLPKFWQATATG